MMSGDHVDRVDEAMMAEMRAWAKEQMAQNYCSTDASSVPPTAMDRVSDEHVLAEIDEYYPGGSAQFVADGGS
jgi:hypothetical protein